MRTISPEELRKKFPKLAPGTFEPKSKATARYNCIGFAAEDDRHWWEAGCNGGRYYWPPPPHRQITDVAAVAAIFTEQGFEPTDNRDIELGYEKIAIYTSPETLEFTHIARSDGQVWKSKLGKGQDIHHFSLDVLEGDQEDEYGIVELILRRAIPV